MVYKFVVKSEEAPNFKLVIAIDSEDTFMQLRNAIVDAVGYGKDQIHSFYICDDEWNKEQEVTLVDMGADSDMDIWLMDETRLDELIEEEGQKLKFVFDILNERSFYIKLKETIPGKELRDPLCERKEGRAPIELKDIDALEPAPKPIVVPPVEDIGEEFYGEDEFNEDELEDFAEIESENL